MPIKNMTPEQIEEATRAQVTAGSKSTDKANRLPGETATEANARLTTAYKELTAKPILTKEQIDGGMKVQFVREQAGGFGTYVAIKPLGYDGPTEVTDFTEGIIPAGTKYTTGSRVGLDAGNRTIDEFRKVLVGKLTAGNKLTDAEAAWLKANGGNTLNPVVTKVTKTPTQTPINTGLQIKNGIMYNNGVPFNGSYNGKTYTNGVIDTSEDNPDEPPVNPKNPSVVDPNKPVITDPNKPAKTLISTQVDDKTGDTIGYFADGSQEILNKGTGPVQSQEFQDAYALLESTFRDYGLESLVPTIKSYMERDLGPEQAKVELRTSPEYIARFKGNQLRLAAGKNALREDIYLATERAYDEVLTSYGQANYFGIDKMSKQLKMAEIIGNDISADEFKSRVDLAVSRVSNADPAIKKLLKEFYPSLNDADLVGYFLNPAEGLPKLQEKVTAAEIGSAFMQQGLDYTQQKSAELAQYGIDRAGALKGAAEIKDVLPESQKLSNIYNEAGIKYTQQTGEEEFFKDNQDAATKRKRLKSMERAQFQSSSGTGDTTFSKPVNF